MYDSDGVGNIIDAFQQLSFVEKCKCMSELLTIVSKISEDRSKETLSKSNTDMEKNVFLSSEREKETVKIIEEDLSDCRTLDFKQKNDVSFTNPVLMVMLGKKLKLHKWSECYFNFIKILIQDERYHDKIIMMAKSGRKDISDSAEKMRRPTYITENLYVESNMNSSDKCQMIKKIMDYCGISDDDVVIYYKP